MRQIDIQCGRVTIRATLRDTPTAMTWGERE